jgi:uncharacterized protein
MLLIRTSIGPSPIHGYGVFADQFIPRGTVIWRIDPVLDIKVAAKKFRSLPMPARDYVAHFGYLNAQSEYVLCFDNAKYFNHSELPNTEPMAFDDDPEGVDVASRDIFSGEELTTDYRNFDADVQRKLPESTNIRQSHHDSRLMDLDA